MFRDVRRHRWLSASFLTQFDRFTVKYDWKELGTVHHRNRSRSVEQLLRTLRINCEARDPTGMLQVRFMSQVAYNALLPAASLLASFCTADFARAMLAQCSCGKMHCGPPRMSAQPRSYPSVFSGKVFSEYMQCTFVLLLVIWAAWGPGSPGPQGPSTNLQKMLVICRRNVCF